MLLTYLMNYFHGNLICPLFSCPKMVCNSLRVQGLVVRLDSRSIFSTCSSIVFVVGLRKSLIKSLGHLMVAQILSFNN